MEKEFHIIGTTVNGQRARFWREYSNEEFQKIANAGLPSGFFAFHLNSSDQEKIDAVGKLPIIVNLDGRITDAEDALELGHRRDKARG